MVCTFRLLIDLLLICLFICGFNGFIGKNISHFLQSSVNPRDVPFLDPEKESKRLKELSELSEQLPEKRKLVKKDPEKTKRTRSEKRKTKRFDRENNTIV